MISLQQHDECTVLEFNRPMSLNALNTSTLAELENRLAELRESDSKVVILTGAGDRAFSSGADITELGERDAAEVRTASRRGQAIGSAIASLPMPSIALLNGYALGGALELALACTFRLATPEALMGFPEIKLGVCTGWGGTQRLPRLIGEQPALDLLLSGRLIDSKEALAMGLIALITDGPPRQSALEFASRFSASSLVAMRYVREAVSRSTDLPLDDGLRAESDLSALSYQSADAVEGISAFIEKRPPNFRGR